ncbi:extracellular repeat protein, HAF family [Haloferula helveola]|uniref:Extracellular repeat protein, HAF family n=1 Tax=Haloferula helveola TaxID=490095 RepID=A0ABM7RHC7_9BACT|nr:extracellular repeat protein, HAF family [Haloferula helveola]
MASPCLHAAGPDLPEFVELPDLGGGEVLSRAWGVSADGLMVCGQSDSASGTEAARWTLPGTGLGLGDLPNSPFQSNAADISGDGTKACGTVVLGVGTVRASRWIEGTGQTQLGTLNTSGYRNSDARGISDDGQKVVGTSTSNNGFRGFIWTATGATSGTMQSVGVLTPTPTQVGDSYGIISQADDISADGQTVIGTSTFTIFQSVPDPDPTDNYVPPPVIVEQGSEAFQWTSASGISGLGDLPGGALSSQALGISDDSQVIVGNGESADGLEGVVWTAGVPMSVGDLPGGDTYCKLLAVSGDGTFAVGESSDDTGTVAVIWDAANGLRKLSTVLEGLGVSLTGWTLTSAVGVSSNGDVVAGNGINPSGEQAAWAISGASILTEVIVPIPDDLVDSIRITRGKAAQFTAETGRQYQLLYSTNLGDWFPSGDPHSSANAGSSYTHALPFEPGLDTAFYLLGPNSNPQDADTPITIINGTLLHFTSEPDYLYQCEYSDNLVDWFPMGPPLDTGLDSGPVERVIIDNSAGPLHPARCYRFDVGLSELP